MYSTVDVSGERNKCVSCRADTKKWLEDENKLRIINHTIKFQHLSGFHPA
jgi:hypothetical protein